MARRSVIENGHVTVKVVLNCYLHSILVITITSRQNGTIQSIQNEKKKN